MHELSTVIRNDVLLCMYVLRYIMSLTLCSDECVMGQHGLTDSCNTHDQDYSTGVTTPKCNVEGYQRYGARDDK